ncbi:N-formylglutamate amidohydrolase [Nitratireductor aquimarinus]|uniref:N-formylglutamate amidohydrolase n=1 Tax=Nitratireductor aquimarinus TaxID=889300 RepID=A0ABU4AI67_9HYPH|nr:N-formylglutamate amidohydrolase [Nitratireductor aquimarinus]MDV6225920.1 N-formylglutamate amidohydrolase [Nitratireductor aquimarinus]
MTASTYTSPFEIIRGDSAPGESMGLVLVADHAKRDLPERYDALGLPESEFERHIAYDIGVEAVTRALARITGAPAVLCGFSRLLIDPNRGINDPTLIRQLYDGTIIPGNYPLSPEERRDRLERYYLPYHDAVAKTVEQAAEALQAAPLIISMHSFTPFMKGRKRPWEVGLLWDRDDRATIPLMEALKAGGDLTVGDNEPYDGAYPGDTMHRHATERGFAHALIEIRQDLIGDEAGANAWAERLAPLLLEINARPEMHEVKHFGSRSDHS